MKSSVVTYDIGDTDESFCPGVIITFIGDVIENIEYTDEFMELDATARDEIINAILEVGEASLREEWRNINH